MARSERTRRTAHETRALTIGALSRATRIPAETLRTWERRYGSPMPERKPSGHRLYPAADVERLRRVGRLLTHGHRAGEILGLSPEELDRLLAVSDPAGRFARSAPPASRGSLPDGHGIDAGATIPGLMQATMDLDREALLRPLRTNWARLGPLRFLEEVAGPFLVAIGRAWAGKELDVRHEHFASACVSDFLREVREPFDQQAHGPRVVAATLPGDRHDGGLLMATTLLAMRGCRVVYLGANTPVEETAAAAREGAEAVAISVSAAVSGKRAAGELATLRALLPPRTPIWVGGRGAPAPGAKSAPTRGIERFPDLGTLDAMLRR